MNESIIKTQSQKNEYLRKTLIRAGYNMASCQIEMISEVLEQWRELMVDEKINPKCIDISEQASHSFYNDELYDWLELDKDLFADESEGLSINEIIEKNGISDDEVFDYLYKGEVIYKNELYGEGWEERYPDPVY